MSIEEIIKQVLSALSNSHGAEDTLKTITNRFAYSNWCNSCDGERCSGCSFSQTDFTADAQDVEGFRHSSRIML